jgi:ribosomal protein S18 acetylase RimI-like enzyme
MAEVFTDRPACESDADGISALINSLLRYRAPETVGPAPDSFVAGFSPQAIRSYITDGNHSYLVALFQDQLVGVLGVRDNRHLLHLFVAEPYQRRGVARMLWDHAKSDALKAEAEIEMFVRSSIYATPVYERFGFTACGPRVDEPGVSYVPMRQVIRRS